MMAMTMMTSFYDDDDDDDDYDYEDDVVLFMKCLSHHSPVLQSNF